MKRVLTQEQLNEIVAILNEMPIKELNRVQAIIGIINEAEVQNEEPAETLNVVKNESDTED